MDRSRYEQVEDLVTFVGIPRWWSAAAAPCSPTCAGVVQRSSGSRSMSMLGNPSRTAVGPRRITRNNGPTAKCIKRPFGPSPLVVPNHLPLLEKSYAQWRADLSYGITAARLVTAEADG
jgi:hypothetical protein